MAKLKRYFWNILIALDQLLNALFAGEPDETVSSRLGKLRRKGNKIGEVGCRILDSIDDNHCEKSIKDDS